MKYYKADSADIVGDVELSENCSVFFNAVIRGDHHKIVIGENTKIVGPVVCTGSLIIGRDCWIGANFTVRGNGTVILGDRIDVGPDVTFITGTHQTGTSEHRAGEGYNCTQTIGNGCWIGAKSIFVNNISIGASCIVAASACVCKTFPANLLIGGVPAKAIKSLE